MLFRQVDGLLRCIELFSNLRSDKSRVRYPAETLGRAPHKPLLLLAVLDLVARGTLNDGRVPLTPELGETFALYWARVMPPHARPNLALPFYHLKNDGGFWRLIPVAGREHVLTEERQIRSVSRLQEVVAGARLSKELTEHVSQAGDRNVLRATLHTHYFSPDAQHRLTEQSSINSEAFEYSEILLGHRVAETAMSPVYAPVARSQGFRRAIVVAYDHRCAMCGIRVLTDDGRTAVEAAHIEPWASSQNDEPTNGLALCRLCHWCFDEGLLGIDRTGTIIVSKRLSSVPNVPAHLGTLDQRPIIGPRNSRLAPNPDALSWHQRHVFDPR